MPVYDVDGGLNFQGYSPRLFTGRLPIDQTASRPFYMGGSQVPVALGLTEDRVESMPTGKFTASKVVRVIPFRR